MGLTFFYDWEVDLMVWLQQTLGDFGAVVGKLFTMFGEQIVVVAILFFLYYCYDKLVAERIILDLLAALNWCAGIKNLFYRRRPYFDHPQIICIKAPEGGDIYDITLQGFSHPSMHSATAFCTYMSLAQWIKKKWAWIVAVILTLGVGFSRFMLGVHYPTDVIAGYTVALFSIVIMNLLRKWIKKKWILFTVVILTCAPGLFYAVTADYYTCFGILVGFCLGILFENKYVNFKDRTDLFHSCIRYAGGIAVFLGVTNLLKLPFDSEFLAGGTKAALLVRCMRYFVATFLCIGPYTMLFDSIEKIGKKKENA